MLLSLTIAALAAASLVEGQNATTQQAILNGATVDTDGHVETTGDGVQVNTTGSLRAGPRGYVLLEDTAVRKKMLHFDRERAPERVVNALGHGAYGTFQSSRDWSNLTTACWLSDGAVSDVFTRFSIVVASNGGSEVGRDTHGFASKIYSQCGNHDLVGNHLASFFINDGSNFPDLIHAVKFEADKGFPTGGSAHTTAYDFFTQHPEGAFQLMNVLSDLGIPRDVRHISGNGVHTYRFINANGVTTLFKWYWLPKLGHRSLVYDEATKIAGENGNFQRMDLFNTINAGIFPQWDFAVQLFPDDGTYMWNGIDLLDATKIIPFEMNRPITLGTLTLNRNPTSFFAEPESISFAPSNVVKGVGFVPDPLLQWRLMSYDDTSTHRHNSPNGYLLPINRAISDIDNNYRDGYMQPNLYVGAATSFPDGIGGVVPGSASEALPYTGSAPENVNGPIARYSVINDFYSQARQFWGSLDIYAQQSTVNGYVFELGHVSNPNVTQTYINNILNNVDNCLARRVAFGVGVTLPPLGSGPTTNLTNATTPYPSLYPLSVGIEPNKSNAGLVIGVLANDDMLSPGDLALMTALFAPQQVFFEVVAPHMGPLASGVSANQSYITTSSVFYDAVIVGSLTSSNTTATVNGTTAGTSPLFMLLTEAYSHGKAIAAIGNANNIFDALDIPADPTLGVFEGDATTVTNQVLTALSGVVRFPQRFPLDDPSICQGEI